VDFLNNLITKLRFSHLPTPTQLLHIIFNLIKLVQNELPSTIPIICYLTLVVTIVVAFILIVLRRIRFVTLLQLPGSAIPLNAITIVLPRIVIFCDIVLLPKRIHALVSAVSQLHFVQ
jgi:hypothetical protein